MATLAMNNTLRLISILSPFFLFGIALWKKHDKFIKFFVLLCVCQTTASVLAAIEIKNYWVFNICLMIEVIGWTWILGHKGNLDWLYFSFWIIIKFFEPINSMGYYTFALGHFALLIIVAQYLYYSLEIHKTILGASLLLYYFPTLCYFTFYEQIHRSLIFHDIYDLINISSSGGIGLAVYLWRGD